MFLVGRVGHRFLYGARATDAPGEKVLIPWVEKNATETRERRRRETGGENLMASKKGEYSPLPADISRVQISRGFLYAPASNGAMRFGRSRAQKVTGSTPVAVKHFCFLVLRLLT